MKEATTRVRRIQGLIELMQKNMECAICLDVLKTPVSTKCDHQFCRFCITECLQGKASAPCPLCKKPVTKRSLSNRPKLADIIHGIHNLIKAIQTDTGLPMSHLELSNDYPVQPLTSSESSRQPLPTQTSIVPSKRPLPTQTSIVPSKRPLPAQTSIASSKRPLPTQQIERNHNNVRHSKRRRTEETQVFIDDLTKPEDTSQLVVTHVNVSGGFPSSKVSKGKANTKSRNGVKQSNVHVKNKPGESTHEVELMRYLAEGSCGAEVEQGQRLPVMKDLKSDECLTVEETEISGKSAEDSDVIENTKSTSVGITTPVKNRRVPPPGVFLPSDQNLNQKSAENSDSDDFSEGEIILAEDDFVKAISRPCYNDSAVTKTQHQRSKFPKNKSNSHIKKHSKADCSTPDLDYGFMQERFGQITPQGFFTPLLANKIGTPAPAVAEKASTFKGTPYFSERSKFIRTYGGDRKSKRISKWIYNIPKDVETPDDRLGNLADNLGPPVNHLTSPENPLRSPVKEGNLGNLINNLTDRIGNAHMDEKSSSVKERAETLLCRASETGKQKLLTEKKDMIVLANKSPTRRRIFKTQKPPTITLEVVYPPARSDSNTDPYEFIPSQKTPRQEKKKRGGRLGGRGKSKTRRKLNNKQSLTIQERENPQDSTVFTSKGLDAVQTVDETQLPYPILNLTANLGEGNDSLAYKCSNQIENNTLVVPESSKQTNCDRGLSGNPQIQVTCDTESASDSDFNTIPPTNRAFAHPRKDIQNKIFQPINQTLDRLPFNNDASKRTKTRKGKATKTDNTEADKKAMDKLVSKISQAEEFDLMFCSQDVHSRMSDVEETDCGSTTGRTNCEPPMQISEESTLHPKLIKATKTMDVKNGELQRQPDVSLNQHYSPIVSNKIDKATGSENLEPSPCIDTNEFSCVPPTNPNIPKIVPSKKLAFGGDNHLPVPPSNLGTRETVSDKRFPSTPSATSNMSTPDMVSSQKSILPSADVIAPTLSKIGKLLKCIQIKRKSVSNSSSPVKTVGSTSGTHCTEEPAKCPVTDLTQPGISNNVLVIADSVDNRPSLTKSATITIPAIADDCDNLDRVSTTICPAVTTITDSHISMNKEQDPGSYNQSLNAQKALSKENDPSSANPPPNCHKNIPDECHGKISLTAPQHVDQTGQSVVLETPSCCELNQEKTSTVPHELLEMSASPSGPSVLFYTEDSDSSSTEDLNIHPTSQEYAKPTTGENGFKSTTDKGSNVYLNKETVASSGNRKENVNKENTCAELVIVEEETSQEALRKDVVVIGSEKAVEIVPHTNNNLSRKNRKEDAEDNDEADVKNNYKESAEVIAETGTGVTLPDACVILPSPPTNQSIVEQDVDNVVETSSTPMIASPSYENPVDSEAVNGKIYQNISDKQKIMSRVPHTRASDFTQSKNNLQVLENEVEIKQQNVSDKTEETCQHEVVENLSDLKSLPSLCLSDKSTADFLPKDYPDQSPSQLDTEAEIELLDRIQASIKRFNSKGHISPIDTEQASISDTQIAYLMKEEKLLPSMSDTQVDCTMEEEKKLVSSTSDTNIDYPMKEEKKPLSLISDTNIAYPLKEQTKLLSPRSNAQIDYPMTEVCDTNIAYSMKEETKLLSSMSNTIAFPMKEETKMLSSLSKTNIAYPKKEEIKHFTPIDCEESKDKTKNSHDIQKRPFSKNTTMYISSQDVVVRNSVNFKKIGLKKLPFFVGSNCMSEDNTDKSVIPESLELTQTELSNARSALVFEEPSQQCIIEQPDDKSPKVSVSLCRELIESTNSSDKIPTTPGASNKVAQVIKTSISSTSTIAEKSKTSQDISAEFPVDQSKEKESLKMKTRSMQSRRSLRRKKFMDADIPQMSLGNAYPDNISDALLERSTENSSVVSNTLTKEHPMSSTSSHSASLKDTFATHSIKEGDLTVFSNKEVNKCKENAPAFDHVSGKETTVTAFDTYSGGILVNSIENLTNETLPPTIDPDLYPDEIDPQNNKFVESVKCNNVSVDNEESDTVIHVDDSVKIHEVKHLAKSSRNKVNRKRTRQTFDKSQTGSDSDSEPFHEELLKRRQKRTRGLRHASQVSHSLQSTSSVSQSILTLGCGSKLNAKTRDNCSDVIVENIVNSKETAGFSGSDSELPDIVQINQDKNLKSQTFASPSKCQKSSQENQSPSKNFQQSLNLISNLAKCQVLKSKMGKKMFSPDCLSLKSVNKAKENTCEIVESVAPVIEGVSNPALYQSLDSRDMTSGKATACDEDKSKDQKEMSTTETRNSVSVQPSGKSLESRKSKHFNKSAESSLTSRSQRTKDSGSGKSSDGGVIYIQRRKKTARKPVIVESDSDSSDSPFELLDSPDSTDDELLKDQLKVEKPVEELAACLLNGADELSNEEDRSDEKKKPVSPVHLIKDDTEDEELDSSQASKLTNLTASSALSSQSELLPTQQRSKLELDVERMKREIEALEAQLATRDSILLDTTMNESLHIESNRDSAPPETVNLSACPRDTEKFCTDSRDTVKLVTGPSSAKKLTTGPSGTEKLAIGPSGTEKLATGPRDTEKCAPGPRGTEKLATGQRDVKLDRGEQKSRKVNINMNLKANVKLDTNEQCTLKSDRNYTVKLDTNIRDSMKFDTNVKETKEVDTNLKESMELDTNVKEYMEVDTDQRKKLDTNVKEKIEADRDRNNKLDTNVKETMEEDTKLNKSMELDTNVKGYMKVDTDQINKLYTNVKETIEADTDRNKKLDTNVKETMEVGTNLKESMELDTNVKESIETDTDRRKKSKTNVKETVEVDTNLKESIEVDTNLKESIEVDTNLKESIEVDKDQNKKTDTNVIGTMEVNNVDTDTLVNAVLIEGKNDKINKRRPTTHKTLGNNLDKDAETDSPIMKLGNSTIDESTALEGDCYISEKSISKTKYQQKLLDNQPMSSQRNTLVYRRRQSLKLNQSGLGKKIYSNSDKAKKEDGIIVDQHLDILKSREFHMGEGNEETMDSDPSNKTRALTYRQTGENRPVMECDRISADDKLVIPSSIETPPHNQEPNTERPSVYASDEDLTNEIPPTDDGIENRQVVRDVSSSEESEDLFLSPRSPSPPPEIMTHSTRSPSPPSPPPEIMTHRTRSPPPEIMTHSTRSPSPPPEITHHSPRSPSPPPEITPHSPQSPSPPTEISLQTIKSSAVSKAVTKLKELFKSVSPSSKAPDKQYSSLSQTPPSTPSLKRPTEMSGDRQRQAADTRLYDNEMSSATSRPKSETPNLRPVIPAGDEVIPSTSSTNQNIPESPASRIQFFNPKSFQSPAFTGAGLLRRVVTTPNRSMVSPARDQLTTPVRDLNSASRKLCFITTGLHLHQVQRTQKFAQLVDAKVQPKFSAATTHVIVKTVCQGRLVCERTFKYFQGIAHHCWIVSYKWVEDSIKAKEILPESAYEIQGDTVSGSKHRGPRRSRLFSVPVFSHLEFYCRGKPPDIPPGEFEKLLTVSGATVVTSPDALGVDPEKTQLIIDVNEEPTPADIRVHNRLFRRYGVVTVSREWVFNSITLYKTQPLDEHILTTVSNIDIPSV